MKWLKLVLGPGCQLKSFFQRKAFAKAFGEKVGKITNTELENVPF